MPSRPMPRDPNEPERLFREGGNWLGKMDWNLCVALDKLGREYGPLGVAYAAAHMTEIKTLMDLLQRDTDEQNGHPDSA